MMIRHKRKVNTNANSAVLTTLKDITMENHVPTDFFSSSLKNTIGFYAVL